MSKEQAILKLLAAGVRDMDEDLAVEASYEALKNGMDAFTAINLGLVTGPM